MWDFGFIFDFGFILKAEFEMWNAEVFKKFYSAIDIPTSALNRVRCVDVELSKKFNSAIGIPNSALNQELINSCETALSYLSIPVPGYYNKLCI